MKNELDQTNTQNTTQQEQLQEQEGVRASSILDTHEEKKIASVLKNMDAYLETKMKPLFSKNNICEEFYIGHQWEVMSDGAVKVPVHLMDGTVKIMRIDGGYSDTRFENIPKRVINITFSTVETEKAVFKKLNPTAVIKPIINENKEYQELAYKLNLFLKQVYTDKARKNMDSNYRDLGITGYSAILIRVNDVETGEIPFELIRIPWKDIKADPEVSDWADVRFVRRTYKILGSELKKQFKDKLEDSKGIKSYETYEIVEWLIYNDNTDRWETYEYYEWKLLRKRVSENGEDTTYNVLPIQVIRMYPASYGWWGIGEVENTMSEQVSINKIATAAEWNLMMRAFPPTTSESDVILNEDYIPGSMLLYPGKNIAVKDAARLGGRQPVNAINTQLVGSSEYEASKEAALTWSERVSGISRQMTSGENQAGVYSAAQQRMLTESSNVRIAAKQQNVRDDLRELTIKILKMAKEYVRGSYYEVYDVETNKVIRLVEKDFDLDKMDVEIDMVEANLLTGQAKMQGLKEFKQYAPELSSDRMLLQYAEYMPGIISKDWLQEVKDRVAIQKEKIKQELEALKAPKNPSPAPGSGQKEVSDEEIINEATKAIVGAGMAEEQARTMVSEIVSQIRQAQPNITASALIDELSKQLQARA